MNLPLIIRQSNERWPFVVEEDFHIRLKSLSFALPFSLESYFRHDGDRWLTIFRGYAFDGVTSPFFKNWLDSIPELLASALVHDVLLQAINDIKHTGLDWGDATDGFRESCHLFEVEQPLRTLAPVGVSLWFNPVFNRFRRPT